MSDTAVDTGESNIQMLNRPKHAFTMICDDIRQEMGGKTSLMGLYDNHIVVPEIPFTLPKVCFYTRILNIRGLYKFGFAITSPDGETKKIIDDSPVEIPATASEGTFNVIASPFDVATEGVYEVAISLQRVPNEGDEQEEAIVFSYKFAISNAQRLQAEYEASQMPTDESASEPAPASAPASAPTDESASEPAPASAPASAPTDESASEPAPAPASEPAPAPASEPAPASASEPAPASAPASAPTDESASEPAPASASEPAPAPASEPASQAPTSESPDAPVTPVQ
jgi:hypothetical protein